MKAFFLHCEHHNESELFQAAHFSTGTTGSSIRTLHCFEKMDGNTRSNWNEAGGTKRRDKRKETMEKACHDGRQSSKN